MKVRHLLLAAGLAVAAFLSIFGDKSPGGSIVEPVTRASAPKETAVSGETASSTRRKTAREAEILALKPREILIGGAGREKASEGLFASQNWTPPPPPPPKPAPPPPPSAPPLPFTYLGKKVEDGVREVFLARGEQMFIVREQTVIDGAYRVDAIKPPTLTLTYLPLNQVQTLTIGGID